MRTQGLDSKIAQNIRNGARPRVATYIVGTRAERIERRATKEDMDDDDLIQLIELLGVDPFDLPAPLSSAS